jgi:hypothetical protein
MAMAEVNNPSTSGAGNAGDNTGSANNTTEGSISKADHDKTVSELKAQIDEVRAEILSPDYLAFLEGGKKPKETATTQKADSIDFSQLTPEQLYNKALADADKKADEKLATIRKEFTTQSKDSVQKEVAAFARKTPDYEKYRPLMYGISLDPKCKDLSMDELYAKAKEHAKGFGPSDADVMKGRRAGSEKPGGSSASFSKDKKYTPDSAAEEAWEETVGKDGFPSI